MRMRNLLICLISALMLSLSVGCAGMRHNAGQHMEKLLTLEFMNSKLETQPIDMSNGGNCPGTVPLKVVSVEKNSQQHVFFRNVLHKHYVVPTEFMDQVATHFENKLVESKLTIDKQNGKAILVSLEEANVEGTIVPEGKLTIKIQIPDLDYARSYSTVEGSANAYYALAYCVHLAIEQFMKDPVFQQFVQCL